MLWHSLHLKLKSILLLYKSFHLIPYGLTARIAGFHPAGPGSTPGMGNTFCFSMCHYFKTDRLYSGNKRILIGRPTSFWLSLDSKDSSVTLISPDSSELFIFCGLKYYFSFFHKKQKKLNCNYLKIWDRIHNTSISS